MHDGVFLSVGVFQFFEDDCAAFFFTGKGLECFVAACGSYIPIHSGCCRLTMLVKLILLMFQFFDGAVGFWARFEYFKDSQLLAIAE